MMAEFPPPSDIISASLTADKEVTNSLYNRNFRTFALWCADTGINLNETSIYTLIKFLRHLHSKKRAFSTINNYKVAILPVFIMANRHDEASIFILNKILRGMRKKQQPRPSFFPQWQVNTVLDYLDSQKFEPLASKPEYIMLVKTIFLIIMASGRRPSDLAGLVIRDTGSWLLQGPNSATFHYHPSFRPKNKSARFFPEPVSIPALDPSNLTTNLSCPVRAAKIYIEHTSSKRSAVPSYLFLPLAPSSKIGPGYISKVVKNLIIQAHKWAGAPVSRDNIQAKQTRKLASSLAYHCGAPLEDVIRSAGWSAGGTFMDHYLIRRPLPVSRNMVVAGSILLPPAETCEDSSSSHTGSTTY